MSKKVLVVDDEKLIVKGIKFSLEQDSMEVDCAYDGEEALSLARKTEYDMVLLDVMLPDGEGYEFCEYIRKKDARLPVIFLTALDGESQVVKADAIPDGWMGLDIGPETVKAFVAALEGAKSVLWNGPMGVFEDDKYAEGTKKLAEAVAEMTQKHGTVTVIGGGDTASAVRQFKAADKVSHVSTGGGASLEYCEGKKLPGMEPFRV